MTEDLCRDVRADAAHALDDPSHAPSAATAEHLSRCASCRREVDADAALIERLERRTRPAERADLWDRIAPHVAGEPSARRASEPFLPRPLVALVVALALVKVLSYGALLPDGAARLLPAALAVAGLCALRANPFRVHPTLPA